MLPDYEKPPLSISEQLQLLKDKGVIIQDTAFATKVLSTVNYYRLSAYLYPFRDPTNGGYMAGTTLEMAWLHYRFDRRLRLHILDALERFEVAFKTQVAYQHAIRYGAFGYRDTANFAKYNMNDYSLRNAHAKLLGLIDDEAKRSQEDFIKHYITHYNPQKGLPIWMAVEIMSFGNMLRLYEMEKKADQKAVAAFFGLKRPLMISWLEALRHVRNICAHHGRLWNRYLSISPATPGLDISAWHDSATPMNAQRIYGVLCVLKYLIDRIAPQSGWNQRLFMLLDDFPNISRKAMGIPKGFDKTSFWDTPRQSPDGGKS